MFCIAAGDMLLPRAGGAEQQPDPQAKQEADPPVKTAKGKKRKGPEQPVVAADTAGNAKAAAPAAPDSVAALKEQLASLQAENKQLKKKQKREERQEKRGAAAAKRKEERAATRGVEAAAAADRRATAAAAAAAVDVSAWRVLELDPAIEQAIAALGFAAPTHVQAECLPAAIRDRRDIIGAAQTGSGKTLAFGLPIMQLLLRERQQQQGQAEGQRAPSRLRALVMAPTRELALQVCQHLQAVGKSVGIWAVPIVGGISPLKQERLLAKHPEVRCS